MLTCVCRSACARGRAQHPPSVPGLVGHLGFSGESSRSIAAPAQQGRHTEPISRASRLASSAEVPLYGPSPKPDVENPLAPICRAVESVPRVQTLIVAAAV